MVHGRRLWTFFLGFVRYHGCFIGMLKYKLHMGISTAINHKNSSPTRNDSKLQREQMSAMFRSIPTFPTPASSMQCSSPPYPGDPYETVERSPRDWSSLPRKKASDCTTVENRVERYAATAHGVLDWIDRFSRTRGGASRAMSNLLPSPAQTYTASRPVRSLGRVPSGRCLTGLPYRVLREALDRTGRRHPAVMLDRTAVTCTIRLRVMPSQTKRPAVAPRQQ